MDKRMVSGWEKKGKRKQHPSDNHIVFYRLFYVTYPLCLIHLLLLFGEFSHHMRLL